MENNEIIVREVELNEITILSVLELSKEWELENNTYGYVADDRSDIEGNWLFLAYDGDKVIGYLFGKGYKAKNMQAVIADGLKCFEIDELYVKAVYRSKGIGKKIVESLCESIKNEYDYLTLYTASKNYKAILHFYIDEIGMDFWSAQLYKKLSD